MDCSGVIERVEGHRAVVRVDRHHCAECVGCVPMTSRDLSEDPEFNVDNRLDAAPGDQVELEMPSGSIYTAYLIAFGVPVAALVLGYVLGALVIAPSFDWSSQAVGAVLALAAGLVFFWVGVRLSRRVGIRPFMKSKAGGAGGSAAG